MSQYDHEFWTSGSDYEDLARTYERNIEIEHPNFVTYCDWCYHCGWRNTDVIYPTYRGPSIP